MGRKLVITAFWLLGFSLGFFGYLVYPTVAATLSALLPALFSDRRVVGAFLAGVAGSIITTITVILWSYLSR